MYRRGKAPEGVKTELLVEQCMGVTVINGFISKQNINQGLVLKGLTGKAALINIVREQWIKCLMCGETL